MNGKEDDANNQKEKPSQKQTTVLILDDHAGWLKILSNVVIELGFIPISVNSLHEAEDALRKTEINIVITDIFFDDIDQGIWLLHTLHELEKEKRVPFVIAISGSDLMGRKQTKALIASHMVVDFILKDEFSKKQLQDALKTARIKNDPDLAAYDSLKAFQNNSYPSSGQIVTITGNASGNTIILGNENEAKKSKKKKS